MNIRTKIVKKALAKEFGFKNVKVVNGTGTAWGWVEARVDLDKPTHVCNQMKSGDAWYEWQKCTICTEFIEKARGTARQVSYEAMRAENEEFGTFSSDDGYGTEHDEFLLQVWYKD